MAEGVVTIEDVARAAGVSRGTVSRVLNASARVSSAAREAVERAVAETGYRANPHARSLASGRNDTVAVLLTRPHTQLFEDPTFSLLLQGVSDGMADTDLALALLLAGTPGEQRRASRFVDTRHVDGLIHLSPQIEDSMVSLCVERGVPVVACGHLGQNPPRRLVWTVTTTDRDGALDAVLHLREQGAQTVAMITGPPLAQSSEDRVRGFRDAFDGHVDPDLVEPGDDSRESGYAAASRLLDRRPDIDGIFCSSDRMALGALDLLRSRGVDVPADVLVAGFDDHEIAANSVPALTTVHQPIRRIGRTAVDMLVTALRGEDPGDRTFRAHLVVRDSTFLP